MPMPQKPLFGDCLLFSLNFDSPVIFFFLYIIYYLHSHSLVRRAYFCESMSL